MRSTIIALSLTTLAGCGSSSSGNHGGGGTPVFIETERNDDPLTANDFGVLYPGDHFFIDGAVREDLADPFDGFAFTAGAPLHVDFQLFENNIAADLDVCLYDPQIDQTISCFATAEHPEVGGVDVFAAGLDFQLVVESFVGNSTYSLEIVVLPLFPRAAQALGSEDASGIRAVGEREEHPSDARAGYRKPRPAPRQVFERIIEVDQASGVVLEVIRVMPALVD